MLFWRMMLFLRDFNKEIKPTYICARVHPFPSSPRKRGSRLDSRFRGNDVTEYKWTDPLSFVTMPTFRASDMSCVFPKFHAKVAELVDALDLGSSGETRESSSLSFRTTSFFQCFLERFAYAGIR